MPAPAIDFSVVIPFRNEEENIPKLLPKLVAECGRVMKGSFEIVCVNDASTDDTGSLLAIEQEKAPKCIKVLSTGPPPRVGVGWALRSGLASAKGRYIITMDGDLSHDPRRLEKIVHLFRNGHDLVIGGRYFRHQAPFKPASRYYLSKLFNWVARRFIRSAVKDLTTGFRGFHRDLLDRVDLARGGFAIHLELNKKLGLACHPRRVAEIPIEYAERSSGKSKLKYLKVFWSYFRLIFTE